MAAQPHWLGVTPPQTSSPVHWPTQVNVPPQLSERDPQKAPAATIEVLTKALLAVLGKPNHVVNVIGTRHGEKLYETLLSREEMAAAQEKGNYFRIPPDLRDLNYGKYVEQGEATISRTEDYHSHNTRRLDETQMKALLLKLECVQQAIRGEKTDVSAQP